MAAELLTATFLSITVGSALKLPVEGGFWLNGAEKGSVALSGIQLRYFGKLALSD